MSSKQLIFGEEARAKLVAGVTKVSRAVTTTLGPKGRNVAIDKLWGAPSVIHDGVSVAREIFLEDKFENMGAQLVKEASHKTNETAGDGTTTSTLLAEKMVVLGMKYVTSGVNPMLMKSGIDKATEAVVAEINRLSTPVKEADWGKVATLSAQNKVIGTRIAEAFKIVGKDGLVEIEDGRGTEIVIKHKEGMEIDRGFESPNFVTDKDKLEASLSNPFILVTDQKISSMSSLMPIIEKMMESNKKFVIIASDFEGDTLAGLVVNTLRGAFVALAIKAPAFGDRRKEILEDIATLVGANLITPDKGLSLKTATIEDLGSADLIKATKDYTKIVGGHGLKENVLNRIALIDKELELSDSDFDKEKLIERKSKLTGGVAVIQVGATSEIEMENLKARVVDAKEATRAAIKSGIIAGGGITFIKAAGILDTIDCESSDEKAGVDLVRSVLSAPIRKLAENSGYEAGWVVKTIEESNKKHFGFNVLTGEFGNMIEEGIIEPALVATSALVNAASVASMVLTTDCLITEIDEAKVSNAD